MKLFLGIILLLFFASDAAAETDILPLLENQSWMDDLAPELKILITLTSLSLVPALFIAMTAFTRIVIVLSMLRQALGLMQTPPNIVIITLAFFLTWFAMQPVFQEVKAVAVVPYLQQQMPLSQALDAGLEPLRGFMISQTREQDFAAVLEMAEVTPPQRVEDIQTEHLIPAFLLSELRTAFQIAFVIFIPFLLVDLIVASTLMALGMIMVPPVSIALPIKIMLFVLIDGWTLVTQSLLGSFWS